MVSGSYRRNFLIRVVAFASSGSGLLYASSNPDSKIRISVTIPAPLRESLSVPWQISQSFILPHSPFVSLDHWQFGNLSLVSSRVGPAVVNLSVPQGSDGVSTGKNGRVFRPWLGLKMLDLNEMIIVQLRERDASFPNVKRGVLVPVVTPGSPAHRAGFRPGDVVIKFDGKPVQSIKEIIEIMGDRVGKPLEVVVQRASDKLVTLTVIPEEANLEM